MNEHNKNRLSVEMVSFSFGPTPSGRVALTSCALAVVGVLHVECLGAELAHRSLGLDDALDRTALRWAPSKADETTGWARLTHRQVFIEGPGAFALNFSFMDRLERSAREAGGQIWPTQLYWAHFEASLATWELWPQPEARAWMERAVLEAQEGVDDGDSGAQRTGRTRRL